MTIRTASIGMSQELRRLATRRLRALVAAGLTLTLAGCGGRTRQQVEGETHWLSSCTEGEACSEGLVCICGVCTATCGQVQQCEALDSNARCVAANGTTYGGECTVAEGRESICVRVEDSSLSDDTGESMDRTTSTSDVETTSEPATTSTMGPTSGPETGDECVEGAPELPPQLSATPRENERAEVLAVLAAESFVATEAEYERALRDFGILVDTNERLETFWWSGVRPAVGSRLVLTLDGSTSEFERAAACVNRWYRASIAESEMIGNQQFVWLTFDGVFNLAYLAGVYAEVSGVSSAEPEVPTPPPDGRGTHLSDVERDGDRIVYSFQWLDVTCQTTFVVAIDDENSVDIVASDVTGGDCERPDGGN